MHVSNELEFGHLVNPDQFDVSRTNPDIYHVSDNKIEWDKRYLHEDYAENFVEGHEHLMVSTVCVITIFLMSFGKVWITKCTPILNSMSIL